MTARILVVDDVTANVRLLEARLTAEYFDVLTAGNGPEALAIAGAGKCDIILLDVMMPGMDGPETLACLRDLPATADTPVIFMTAKAQRHETAQYLSLGAIGVIPKPFDPLELSETIQEIWQSGLESGNARHAG